MPARRRARAARLSPTLTALACAAALAPAAHAQSRDDGGALRVIDARTRLGAERLHLPGGERLGLVGLTELMSVGGDWWFGPGVYGAATGIRGGLFVPGVEGAWSHPLRDWIAIDAGVFAGGGGGGNAPVGGGLMLRTHADLVFRFPGFYTGPTFSNVRFVNGSIHSNQVGWMFNFASPFRYRPADSLRAGALTDGRATGLGFDRVSATFTLEKPHHALFTSGAPQTRSMGLVGARGETDIAGPLWAGIETAGAATGGVGGYAEVLGTTGLRWAVVDHRLALGVRASLGLGGGGAVDTGGGLLAKAAAGATLRVTDAMAVSVEAGLAKAVRHGHFKAETAAVSLDWQLDAPDTSWAAGGPSVEAEATRTEFVAGAERYPAARKDGTRRVLEAVSLSMNRFVSPHFYITGQTHSAFAGGAGAYTAGLLGVGTQWPIAGPVRLGAELSAGAAGGGGVDTQGGALLQARAYADVALSEAVSLRLGAGRVKSVHGGVDATEADAAVVFRFGVDRRR